MNLKQRLEDLPPWVPFVLVVAGVLLLVVQSGFSIQEGVTTALALLVELSIGAGGAVISWAPVSWIPTGLPFAVDSIEPVAGVVALAFANPVPSSIGVLTSLGILEFGRRTRN